MLAVGTDHVVIDDDNLVLVEEYPLELAKVTGLSSLMQPLDRTNYPVPHVLRF